MTAQETVHGKKCYQFENIYIAMFSKILHVDSLIKYELIHMCFLRILPTC